MAATKNLPNGTPVHVLGYLIGHGPAGEPCIAIEDGRGGLNAVWVKPDKLTVADGVDRLTAEANLLLIGLNGGKRFSVFEDPDSPTLQNGFASVRAAAAWAAERDPEAVIQLSPETAQALGREPTDLS